MTTLLAAAHPRMMRWTRPAADFVRAAIFTAALLLFMGGNAAAGLKALLVLPAAFAGRLVPVPRGFDLVFAFALLADVMATSLGAYDSISWSDGSSHILLPLLSAPILYAGIVRIRGASEPNGVQPDWSTLGAGLVTAAAVLCVGGIWEVVEWVADAGLGTDFSQGRDDTLGDLRNDAIAAVCGGGLVAVWTRVDGRR